MAAAAATLSCPAWSQTASTIKLLVGFPAGGSTDAIARVMAEHLQKALGRPVIVDNRPGIAGRMATVAVKNAAPGEALFMVAPNAIITQQLMYPTSVLRYDLLTDLQPVATLVSFPQALAVHPSLNVRNVREYIAWVKAGPAERQMFGNGGLGSESHFYGVELGKIAGLPLSVVPYRGNGPMVVDLVGGQIKAGIAAAGDLIQHEKAGKLKVIGLFGRTRSALMPDVPTLREQGFSLAGPDGWTGIWAPATMPREEVRRVESALEAILRQPDLQAFFSEKAAAQVTFRGGSETDRNIREELAYWAPVIQSSGYKPE
jgi:tripartite-type tricarboxylate transporter receptor subunit TctC